jgi:hypothetical protein
LQEIRGGLGPVLRLIKARKACCAGTVGLTIVRLLFAQPHVLLQRDGYFYVTQGEKTLANQTHAGV